MTRGTRIDPEAAALIEARILAGDSIAEIARATGIPYYTVHGHAKQAFERMQQDTTDYKALVLEAFEAYWRTTIAQVQLAGERDWLLDFPKEKFPELHAAIANQGFKFLSVLDFSEGEGAAQEAGGTGPDESAGGPEPLDGEFVETHPQLPPGDSLP